MLINLQILVPSSLSNSERGEFFENFVANIFRKMRFTVVEQLRFTGMEIDLLAENVDTYDKAYVECKFIRDKVDAPIIAKLIGNAIQRTDVSHAYLFSTSQPNKDAKARLDEIRRDNNLIRGVLRFAYIGPNDLIDMYLDVHGYASLERRIGQLPVKVRNNVSAATLIITPFETGWVLELSDEGFPSDALVISVNDDNLQIKKFSSLESLIREHNLWPGIQLINGIGKNDNTAFDIELTTRRDIVTPVPMADRFDDYGPARPQDFVGRKELQGRVWEYLERVRTHSTNKRILAISGPSGFGKSSSVLKLADKARNKRWQKHYYIYHVDSRSAGSPLFVIEALIAGLQKAIEDGFVNYDEQELSIESVETPFLSKSVRHLLSKLEKNNQVIVIFFDQFEELLIKESLFGAFEAFKRLAFETESLQSNLVLGFSWRTGISVPEAHPAYYMWHSLQDKRIEFKVGPFTNKEAIEMVGILEKNLNNKLEGLFRRHLLEQSQGLPWLLKKFCVHVYRKLKSGVDQRKLLDSQLDAKSLFEEDTRELTTDQTACLRYIALNSPIDLLDVHEKFGSEIPEHLYNIRLIIRSGYRYSVYWDIFREYMISGTVPPIPMTFFPQSQMTTVISVWKFIGKEGTVSVDRISEQFKYSVKTVWNILGDLSAFFLVKRGSSEEITVVDELLDASDVELASYIAERLRRHVVVQAFYDIVQIGDSIPLIQLEYSISELYPSTNPDSLHSYMMRLLSWLRFSGLAEMEDAEMITRPIGDGEEKGNIQRLTGRFSARGEATFLCASGPTRVIELAANIIQTGGLDREEILSNENRNAAQDLSALNLATWQSHKLIPIGLLAEIEDYDEQNLFSHCRDIVKVCALETEFLQVLQREVSKANSNVTKTMTSRVKSTLKRDWKPSSAARYINAGMRWLDYFGQLKRIQGQLSLFNDKSDIND